jgi:hypothetical protein
MDDNQRQLAEQKMRDQEMKTMLQSSVRFIHSVQESIHAYERRVLAA